MAVYKRGYQRYRGPLTGRGSRLLVLPRYAWQRLLQQRIVLIVLVISLFWPLACAGFIYVANHTELWQGFGGELTRLLKIDGSFFLIFMNLQSLFAVLLAAFAGPSLVAPDLANNALPLYFSRPFSRSDYVLARLAVLIGLLSPVTWIPGILLFMMQSGMAGWAWFTEYWNVGAGMLAGFLLLILQVSLVALTSSAYVKWRVVAGALILAFFFLMAGAAEMINGILRVTWGSVLNPLRVMYRLWASMLGADPPAHPEIVPSVIMLAVLTVILIWILSRKLRPVEVIS